MRNIFQNRLLTVALVFFIITSFCSAKSHIIKDMQHFIIKSHKKSKLEIHRKIWVGGEKGKSLGKVLISNNEYFKVKNIKGKILDKNGRTIQRLKKKDIRKFKGSFANGLYTGICHVAFQLSHTTFPYIVEYSYELEINSLFFWKSWLPQSNFRVIKSIYELTVPEDILYKTYKIGDIRDPITSNNGKTLTWILNDIPEFESEYRMPPEDRIQYALLFEPDKFFLEGRWGSFESWESFGSWCYSLYKGQYDLSPESLSMITIADSLLPRNKVKEIYSYIQNQTRYVGMEFGIHNWKPHSAQSVFDNKYGDCKDLATFMISLLQNNGVPAYPAIILTRDKGNVYKELPSNQFNHVIAFVPLKEETLWVDCTSDYTTIDDLPYRDEGCGALVIKNGIGVMTKTPISKARDNRLLFEAEIEINMNGNARIRGSLKGWNNSNQYLRRNFVPLNDKDRRKKIIQWLSKHAPLLQLKNLKFVNMEFNEKSATIEFEGVVKHYANVSRNRIFINLNFFHRVNFKGEDIDKRKSSVFYFYPFTQIDRISYIFPKGLIPEAIPDSVSLIYPFGEYRYTINSIKNKFILKREFQIKKRKINLSDYNDYYNFMKTVEKIDNGKIVLKR